MRQFPSITATIIVALPLSLASGQETPKDSPIPFTPGSYSRYGRQAMAPDDRDAAIRGGSQYMDVLIEDLLRPIPEFAEWLRRGCINANPNQTSATRLHLLADNYIPFSKEHIDGLIKGLDHPYSVVVWEVQATLVQLFGISFGAGWVHRDAETRRGPIEAWRKFWRQNRDRYGQGLPLVINDLSLDARLQASGSQVLIVITVSNIGDTDWRIYTEVEGTLDAGKRPESRVWEWPYTLMVNDREEYPVRPASYYITSRLMLPAERAALPDRPAHIERIVIPKGRAYTYAMDATQAFPRVDFAASTNIVVRYKYKLWNTHTNEPLWRGELRSLPIGTINSKTATGSNE